MFGFTITQDNIIHSSLLRSSIRPTKHYRSLRRPSRPPRKFSHCLIPPGTHPTVAGGVLTSRRHQLPRFFPLHDDRPSGDRRPWHTVCPACAGPRSSRRVYNHALPRCRSVDASPTKGLTRFIIIKPRSRPRTSIFGSSWMPSALSSTSSRRSTGPSMICFGFSTIVGLTFRC